MKKSILTCILLSSAVVCFTSCKPSNQAPEKAESESPTEEAAKAPEKPPVFSLSESFDGDAEALRQKGWKVPDFASVAGDIPGANGKALRVQVDDPQKGKYAELYIPVETGKSYKASVRIRAEEVKKHENNYKNRGAAFFLQLADKDKKFVKGGSYSEGLMGDKDWTEVKVPYTTPISENVRYLHVMVGVEGQGTAYFDDLHVTELDPGWEGPEIVQPADGSTVQTRRPVIEWKHLKMDASFTYRRVELSRDPAFPADKTISIKPLGYQAMPNEWLEPGTWYCRVRVVGVCGNDMPPPAAKSFVVAPDAVAWPPTITPSWSWSAEPRPEMGFRIVPQLDAKTQFAVTIDGVPAEVLGMKDGEIRFRPTADLATGAHPVKLTVTAPGQEPMVAEGVFSNRQVTKKVSFREDRVMLVDGKPFLPIGTYLDPSDRNDDFTGVLQAGFNITHSYDFERPTATIEKARAYLDAAQAAGVKVFMGIPRKWFFARDWNAAQQWVAALMDHPALLVWYLMDEPETVKWKLNPDLLRQFKDMVKMVDPFHPTAVVYFKPEQGDYWAEANPEDIAWHDPYPIGSNRELTMVGEDAAAQRKSIGDKKPMWSVFQGHDVAYWNDPKGMIQKKGMPTRPTLEDTRFMVFHALTSSTDGFLWYWAPPKSHYCIVKDTPSVWAGIVETSHLLKRMEPWLVASPKAGDNSIKVREPFRIWTREVDGKRLLVLVNTGKKSESIDLDLGAFKPKTVTNFESGTEVALAESRLKAEFAAKQVMIYQLDLAN
jgi:hypothetical protein